MWCFIFVFGVKIQNNVTFWTMDTQKWQRLASNKCQIELKETTNIQNHQNFTLQFVSWTCCVSCKTTDEHFKHKKRDLEHCWVLIGHLQTLDVDSCFNIFAHLFLFEHLCTDLSTCPSVWMHTSLWQTNNFPLHPPLCFHLFFLPLVRICATFLQYIAFF